MKKHLIAAAVAAAVAVPAAAQVTVSGTLDVSAYGATKVTVGNPTTAEVKAKATSFNNTWTTSTINFSGSEDLGGGLKASFFVNSAINNGFMARDRYLELSGGFGSFRFGRYEATTTALGGFVTASGSTNAGGTFESGAFDMQDGTLGAGNGFSMGRNDNLIRYVTPAFGGFTVTAEYRLASADTAAITANSTVNAGKAELQQQGLRLDYRAGPLAVAGSYTVLDIDRETATGQAQADTVGARSDQSTMKWIGATYDFGVARLNFAHAQRKDEIGAVISSAIILTGGGASTTVASASATTSDIKVSTVGIAVPIGALTLSAGMYEGSDDAGNGSNDDLDLKGHQLAARYTLSKRTSVYAVVSQNKDANESPNGAANYFKTSGYAVGFVHSF